MKMLIFFKGAIARHLLDGWNAKEKWLFFSFCVVVVAVWDPRLSLSLSFSFFFPLGKIRHRLAGVSLCIAYSMAPFSLLFLRLMLLLLLLRSISLFGPLLLCLFHIS